LKNHSSEIEKSYFIFEYVPVDAVHKV